MHHNLILAFIIVFFGAPAFSQNSLGDGNALDSSTSLLGRVNELGNLPMGVRNIELRQINVLQGRNFNEGIGRDYENTVGMQLLADAAQAGGEDYLDALYNSPWYWNNWDQQSARFLLQGDHSYFNPSFSDAWATAPAQMASGRSIRTYSHEWSAETARKFGRTGELAYPADWSKRQVDQYKLGQVLGSGTMQDSLSTTPVPVGLHRTQDSTGYFAASPMTGVLLETTDTPTSALGFSAWDAARIARDNEDETGSGRLVQPWRTAENRLEQLPINTQVDVSDQYNNVLQTITDRVMDDISMVATDDAKTMEWLESQYFLLQNELAGIPFIGDEEEDGTIVEATEPTDADELSDDAIENIAAALRHGERISHFSSQHLTRFDELVQLGELELVKGNYFDAQRRFNQALQFIPGHPLATAGLGHAKIGAGLYLSAGYILQSLISFQPEMIDVEYDAHLLPPRIELVRAAVTVSNRLDIARDAGTYAFLLAYIGHQLHDQEMVETGLETLKIHTDADDPIIPLLRLIWLEREFMPTDSGLPIP